MIQVEKLKRSEAILELGKKIASQLTIKGKEDIISAWMGHHIAELIAAVENDPSDLKSRDRCVRTILEIWAHKSTMPNGTRPFEKLEPVIRTIEDLDPKSSTRFFARDYNLDGSTDLKGENTWISQSYSIDRAARVMIQYCLEQATSELTENSAELAEIAKSADVDLGIFDPILLLTHGEDDKNVKAIRKSEKERLKSNIKNLERLLEISTSLKHDMQNSLNKLEEET